MDGPINSDVKERPARGKAAPSREQNGVVDLPWPDEKDRQAKSERRETDDSGVPKGPKTEQQSHTEKTAAREQPAQQSIWARVGPIIGVIIALAIAAGLVWWALKPSEAKVTYTSTKAAVATVTVTAHAQGRLAARNPVDVVAPAGGRLADATAAKSGDRVSQGQVLARLISESARSDVVDANAEVAASQSAVMRADADVTEARAALTRAKGSNASGAADTAEARLVRANARATEARASLGAVQARLTAARTKLDGLVVRAPFAGIVLKSSLETPEAARTVARGQTLFTLVRNLSEFELVTDFPENAVGTLRAGQPAMFTVSAFPHRIFSARLDSIGSWPKAVHKDGGDITFYSGSLSTVSRDEGLRPGMNADVAVVLAQAKDVLTVPNAALMFRPAANIEAKYKPPQAAYPAPVLASASASSQGKASLGPLASTAGSWSPVSLSSTPRPGRVWVPDGDTLRPRDVMVGLSDGNITQVISGDLQAGDAVITGAIVQARSNANKS